MKLNKGRQFAQVALFSLMALSASTAFAQATRPIPTGGDCICSNPVNVHIVKNSGATSANASDFAGLSGPIRLNEAPYNATQVNKHFTDTQSWKMPRSTTCELKGTVSIKLKNLGTITSNDSAGVVAGTGVSGFGLAGAALWGGQGAGALKTLTYNLTSTMMKRGMLSVFVQDDTAVQEIKVDIVGCCIDPN